MGTQVQGVGDQDRTETITPVQNHAGHWVQQAKHSNCLILDI